MKKWVRKAISVALSGALLLGASGMAGATGAGRNSTSKFTDNSVSGANAAASDTDCFYLIKNYKYQGATTGVNSPGETFTYTISPYGVWNADGYVTSGITSASTNMIPTLLNAAPSQGAAVGKGNNLQLSHVITANYATLSGTATDKKQVFLPQYPSVGDYWYQVQETIGTTAGVVYGTNSNTGGGTANSGYTATYYIHVQVTDDNGNRVRNVTMHKNAPTVSGSTGSASDQYNAEANTNYATGTKVNDIENTYYAGDLVIKKAVTGNAGELDRYFKVTVEFTKPTGTNVNSTISYTAIPFDNTYPDAPASSSTASAQTISSGAWDATSGKASATFWIRASDTSGVTFYNIPYGVNYSVTETLPSDYQSNTIEFTSSSNDSTASFNSISGLTTDANGTGTSQTAQGSITDANDEITITNNKDVAIDIGVITENAPYMSLMAVCAAAAVLMVARKKRIFED